MLNSSIWRTDKRSDLFRSEWIRDRWQWRITLHCPMFQHYWNPAIRWFNVISETHFAGMGSYSSAEMQSMNCTAPGNDVRIRVVNLVEANCVLAFHHLVFGKFFSIENLQPELTILSISEQIRDLSDPLFTILISIRDSEIFVDTFGFQVSVWSDFFGFIRSSVWFQFYGISTTVDYLMPNPLYTHISNIYMICWLFGFYGISTFVGHLMPNPCLYK